MQTPHTAPSVRYPGYVLAYNINHDTDSEFDTERPHLRRVATNRGAYICKNPGEIHLGRGWLYDVPKALELAKSEVWGLNDKGRADLALGLKRPPTPQQERRRAVDLDADNLRRWIDGSWNYVFVNVRIGAFPDGVTPLPGDLGEGAVMGGIECGLTAYGEVTEDDAVQTLGDELIETHLARQRAASVSEVARREAVARARAALKPITVQELGLYLDIPDDAVVREDGWVQAWVGVYAPDTGYKS